MRIKTVELDNFRIHDHTLVEFRDGINLILGPNGSGKSSVLEGIGLALFNTGLRGNQGEAVRAGQSMATIEVELEGNDGNFYRVLRRIGNGAGKHELYQNGKLVADRTGSVVEKMRHICGISGRVDEVFENVITAYQNRMTEQFLKRPAERRSFFNRVFETEIYDTMASGYLKDYVDGLNRESLSLNGSLAILKPETGRLKEVTEEIGILKNSLSDLADTIKNQSILLEELRLKKESKEELQRKLMTQETERKNRLLTLRSLGEELREKLEDLEKAEIAAKVVKANIDGAKEYEMLSNRESSMTETAGLLEAKDRNITEFQNKVGRLEKQLSVLETTVANDMDNLSRLKLELEGLGKDHEELLKTRQLLHEREENSAEKFVALNTLVETLKKEVGDLEDIQKSVDVKRAGLGLLQKDLSTPDDIESDLEKLSSEITLQKKTMEEFSNLRATKAKLEEKLRNIDRSSENLSGGTCPILKEECLNIKKFGDVRGYFQSKKAPLLEELATIKAKLECEKSEQTRLEGLQNRKIMNEERLGSLNKVRRQVGAMEDELKAGEREREILAAMLLETIGEFETLSGLKPGEGEKIVETAATFMGAKKSELLILRRDRDEADEKISKLRNEISIREGRAEKLETSIRKNLTLKSETIMEIGNLNSVIAKSREETAALPAMRNEINALRLRKSSLQKNYETYQQNRRLAEEVDPRKIRLRTVIDKTTDYSKETAEQFIHLSGLRKKHNPDELEELKRLHTEKEQSLNRKRVDEGGLKTKLETLNDTRTELTEKKRQQDGIEKQLAKLGQKILLARKLKTNLKTMGEKVAAVFRKTVQQIASENFKKISGRNEQIVWGDDYEVYLMDNNNGENNRTFANISGGEQIMVSLCIRAAMSTAMSDAKLVIFDEPTVNLDKERKDLLAQTLTPLLGELEQAIIVTHDEIFSEMAQQTIRFDRD